MPNPYAAKRRQPLELPLGRLRRLGATDEQVEALQQELALLSNTDKRDQLRALARLSDDEVREGLEWSVEDGKPVDDEPVPAGTIAEVLNWVGESAERARRALEVERAGRNRTSLVYELEKRA